MYVFTFFCLLQMILTERIYVNKLTKPLIYSTKDNRINMVTDDNEDLESYRVINNSPFRKIIKDS